jgi:hypothetical protein
MDNFWNVLFQCVTLALLIPSVTWFVIVMVKAILRELFEQLMPEERYAKPRKTSKT